MKKTLLFIPMYNCSKQIVRVLGQLNEDICQYITEAIIINNRSTDDGELAVQKYLSEHQFPIRISLLRNNENYGLGGSHKVAFQYAIDKGFDYVIVLHGDDQGNICDLGPYLKSGEAYKYDSFLGSRFENGSKLVNYSKFRIFGNHIFNYIMSIVLKKRISDLGAGLNMYKVKYLDSKFYQNFIDTLSFNVYMLMYGVYSKSSFRFFALSWREDDQISNAKFFRQALEILRIMAKYLFMKEKVFNNTEANTEKKYKAELICSNRGDSDE